MNEMVRLPETPEGELGRALTLVESKLRGCLSFGSWINPEGGGRVLSGSMDTTARVWSDATGVVMATLASHTGYVLALAANAAGTRVATGSADGTVKIWNQETGALLHTLPLTVGWIRSLAFVGDEQNLAVGAASGDCVIVNPETGITLRTFSGNASVVCVAENHSKTVLCTAAVDGTVTLWSLSTGLALHTLTVDEGEAYGIEFSPDGSTLAVAEQDGPTTLWNANTGTLVRTLNSLGGDAPAARWSTDATLIATLEKAGVVKLWNSDTGNLLFTLSAHTSGVGGVHFSPDSSVLATSGFDGNVKLWDPSEGTLTRTLSAHTGIVFATKWSHDGSMIATAGQDGAVKLWNASSGTLIRTLTGHTAPVIALLYLSADVDGVYLLHGPECAPGACLGRYVIIQPDTDLRVDKIALTGPAALAITGSVILHFAQRVTPADTPPDQAMETVWHNVSVILSELLADAAFQAAKPDEISMSDESDPDPFVAVRVSVTLAPIEPEDYDS